MGVLDNFKRNLLKKKVNKKPASRTIQILPLDKNQNILIILEKTENEKEIKNHLQLVFPNAKMTTLSFRPEKVDDSLGFFYSFHPADLGFNKIKNDRLIGLQHMNFDIVIDFITTPNDLDYFVSKTDATLKIGNIHSSKNYLYDLLLERGNSYSDFIENIKTQILLLSNNENK